MSAPIFSSTQTIAFKYIACMTCFLISGSKKAMMQFQIVSGMISKIKKARRVNYNKDSIIQRSTEKRKI